MNTAPDPARPVLVAAMARRVEERDAVTDQDHHTAPDILTGATLIISDNLNWLGFPDPLRSFLVFRGF